MGSETLRERHSPASVESPENPGWGGEKLPGRQPEPTILASGDGLRNAEGGNSSFERARSGRRRPSEIPPGGVDTTLGLLSYPPGPPNPSCPEDPMLESYLKVRLPKLAISSLAIGALCLTTGCATNPATGRSQLSLYNEAQEIQIGQSSDPQIVQQYGLYDDPELAAYVDEIGQDLAAQSERPNLPWTFRVLDDPVINAFALPGGYIYVTRGILGHMGSEAELAAVLGHEIGHVTARHGVNRMSKAQLAGVGLGLGSILAPELARSVGGLAQQGMQLLFLKYSRDDERQADSLGFRYVDRTGYTPEAFVDMFSMLSASSSGSKGSRLPGYLLTHPEPEQRLQAAHARLAEMPSEMLQRPWKRDPFMDRLDGLPYGANPDEGFFVENAFVHPGLGLRIELPDGWTGHNQKHAVVAVSPNNDALFQLSPAQERSVDEAAKAFYGNQSISVRSSWKDDDPNIPPEGNPGFFPPTRARSSVRRDSLKSVAGC